MERTKLLGSCFSFEREVQLPGRPVVSLPFDFNRDLGREEVTRLQESIQAAPFCPAADTAIGENQQFRYVVFAPAGALRFDRAIILLHGLNERSWQKYLTWAEDLVMTCGVPVVLFPIAFHMNRTPTAWYTPRGLVPWLNRRKQEFKNLYNASFFNLALSSRLSVSPLRFYTSGLESAFNLIQLINDMKQGRHPLFTEPVRTDFFAYSIGALLAQVVLMADPYENLSDSRLFTFCGGSVFERMNGNSRDIMDQEAYQKIREYYLDGFHNFQPGQDSRQTSISDKLTNAFRLMIRSADPEGRRRMFFAGAKERVLMISLRQDIVIPTVGLNETTGQELAGYITQELDFPYAYTHQSPFPENGKICETELVTSFRSVFDRAAGFLA
ncbi:MAG: DUF6051 family protein [Bacteroidales bacterium]|jgi:hypothetical protein|nr:DUF6051 family protein [Bacteroidales bacterium]